MFHHSKHQLIQSFLIIRSTGYGQFILPHILILPMEANIKLLNFFQANLTVSCRVYTTNLQIYFSNHFPLTQPPTYSNHSQRAITYYIGKTSKVKLSLSHRLKLFLLSLCVELSNIKLIHQKDIACIYVVYIKFAHESQILESFSLFFRHGLPICSAKSSQEYLFTFIMKNNLSLDVKYVGRRL